MAIQHGDQITLYYMFSDNILNRIGYPFSASNQHYSSITSDDNLAPNKRQAIIWINDYLGCQRIY